MFCTFWNLSIVNDDLLSEKVEDTQTQFFLPSNLSFFRFLVTCEL